MTDSWRVFFYNPYLNRWSSLWFPVIAAEGDVAFNHAMKICLMKSLQICCFSRKDCLKSKDTHSAPRKSGMMRIQTPSLPGISNSYATNGTFSSLSNTLSSVHDILTVPPGALTLEESTTSTNFPSLKKYLAIFNSGGPTSSSVSRHKTSPFSILLRIFSKFGSILVIRISIWQDEIKGFCKTLRESRRSA
jgi:hypothetical protein